MKKLHRLGGFSRSHYTGLLLGGLALAVCSGCASREITVEIASKYINTAMHAERSSETRTGEPLEVAVVCVYPADLKRSENFDLRPEKDITAREWFARAPQVGDKETMDNRGTRFWIPADQIYLLTNRDRDLFGTKVHEALQGAAPNDRKTLKVSVKFDGWSLHDDMAVIYVFPKFVDRDGNVLPVRPAKFHPPGAYEAQVVIEVGVQKDRETDPSANYGQYIINKTPRKMHGKG